MIPNRFGLPQVDCWQAVGILILAKLIYGFGGGSGSIKYEKPINQKFTNKYGPFGKYFSEWKHYDEFWKEERGKLRFKNYIARMPSDNQEVNEY